MSAVPGITAKHAIITPNCRTVARPHLDSDPRMAAFEEAVGRLRNEYRAICDGNGEGEYRMHLVLAYEPAPARYPTDSTLSNPVEEEGTDG